MFRGSFVLIVCALATQSASADTDTTPTVVPRPAEMEVKPGHFQITSSTSILVRARGDEPRAVAEYLAEWLRWRTGYAIVVGTLKRDAKLDGQIILAAAAHADLPNDYYSLNITTKSASLFAPSPRGLFLGVQTLRQLLPPEAETAKPGDDVKWQLPCVRINDQPRYRWRGMLLDCGRHFMDKEFVKRYIDLLAYHKMNVLHWHLTEDQGWRIEIKEYPKLTEVGAWREATRDSEQPRKGDRYGGFYTHDDIREIVAYAKSRYITVVPEIELPGHSGAALAAYPELGCKGEGYEVASRWGVHKEVYCAGNDEVFKFLQNVLTEVVILFPSKYIHIGGDECPKERWKTCEKCQARIKTEGLEDEHELQSYFIRRIETFLNSKNRSLIGWDEILEGGLAPNATVQSWRGMKGALAAATQGHDVISSPTSHCYLDYAQVRMPGEPTFMGFIPLERSYAFEPTPAELTPEQAKHVLGLEGNMWTEHAPQNRVDWQVFPRLCALSEVGWSPKEARNWDDFTKRMKTHYQRLDALGVTYFIPPPKCVSRETVFTESIDVAFENPLGTGVIHYTLDGSDPTQNAPKFDKPITLTNSATVKAQLVLPNGRRSAIAEYEFRKEASPEPASQPSQSRLRIDPDKLPRPSPQQVAWQEMEMHAFVHFGMNTFTNREWGEGTEDPQLFNPTEFDARQWVKAFKDAGMKQVVVTAKHHDGFCLWPSKYTEHSVKNSPWQGGKGDVVGEVAKACREFGLKLGIYLSPWDRHEPTYGDSPRYNEHYVKQLRELLTNYGPVHEVWFDGACGEGPNGKRQVYDWDAYYHVIRELAPDAVVFADNGDVRWVGNEHGYAGETCWSMLHRGRFRPGTPLYAQLTEGHADGPDWAPAECDVSIRPGWFYHPEQDERVKSLAQLLDIYYNSVGRNGVLLLNVPPDQRGLIHENDVARLKELRTVLDETFQTNLAAHKPAKAGPLTGPATDAPEVTDGNRKTYWCAADGVYESFVAIDLGAPVTFDRIMLAEPIENAQRIAAFRFEIWNDGDWQPITHGTTIGYKRLLRIDPVTTSRIRVVILDALAPPALSEIALYKASPREPSAD